MRLLALVFIGIILGSPVFDLSNPPLSTGEGPRRVSIVAHDYFFDAPDTLPAGPTIFQLENRGQMAHELAIFAARKGVSAAQMLAGTSPEERRAGADPPIGVL